MNLKNFQFLLVFLRERQLLWQWPPIPTLSRKTCCPLIQRLRTNVSGTLTESRITLVFISSSPTRKCINAYMLKDVYPLLVRNGILFFGTFRPPQKKILDNILEAIGRTPLVKLNKIPQSLGIECDVCKLLLQS